MGSSINSTGFSKMADLQVRCSATCARTCTHKSQKRFFWRSICGRTFMRKDALIRGRVPYEPTHLTKCGLRALATCGKCTHTRDTKLAHGPARTPMYVCVCVWMFQISTDLSNEYTAKEITCQRYTTRGTRAYW